MEQLMEIARKQADHVEIFSDEGNGNVVSFENAQLKDIDSKMLSGVALRLFKERKVGTAYTQNLIDRTGLVNNALASLQGGVEASYPLPRTASVTTVASYDPAIERLTNTKMVEECTRVCQYMTARTKGQVNTTAGAATGKIRLMNSLGTDLRSQTSSYFSCVAVSYPGTYTSVLRQHEAKNFEPLSVATLDHVLGLYNQSLPEASCKPGRMKVLFLPEAMYALIWRLTEAANAKAVYEKVSPIRDRMNELVFSDKLTIVNDPLTDRYPGARAFDDEGTLCRTLPIVENGFVRNFYSDLFYAQKLGTIPTGNGFRGEVQYKPHPALNHLIMKPGTKSFAELLKLIDIGVIVGGAMGAHSGNILNGDFSIGMDPGILVQRGEILGQVKNGMVAGNIYETLKNVIALEDTAHEAYMGRFPAVLFDEVSVATRS